MMKVILALACFVVIALAANPTPPVWPTAFSATILHTDAFGGMRVSRWFYDNVNMVERFDGLRMWQGEMYWIEDIRDYTTDVNTFVAFLQEEVSCFTGPVNGTMIDPNFQDFQYAGLSFVGFTKANHWMLNNQNQGMFLQLWDDAVSREIIRIDIANEYNGMSETWTFMEMNVGAQDPSLFVVNPTIAPICNSFKK